MSTPSGPPPGPPPGPGAREKAAASSGSTGGIALTSRQVVAIALAVAVVLAVVVGVLLAGGSSEAQGETVQLEPTTASGDNPFMPSLAPGGSTPPSTTAPASAAGPFGGTGDDTLCDRSKLVAFLTDPTHVSQANAWAGALGISVGSIPSYVLALVPTVLARDTAVTNYSFVSGRAVPYQAVLQSGTAVLADTQGALVARCESGNPLREARPPANPVYTGPRWQGFDPSRVVIIVLSNQRVFTPGTGELDDYDVAFAARGANIQTTDSLAIVTWRGTLAVNPNGTLTGRARGRVTFAGECFRGDVGYSDLQFDATFDLTIAGTTAGRPPNRTYTLGSNATAPAIGAINGANLDAPCRALATGLAPVLVTQALGPLTVPAREATTRGTSGPYNLVINLS
jgi:hypothetical protein